MAHRIVRLDAEQNITGLISHASTTDTLWAIWSNSGTIGASGIYSAGGRIDRVSAAGDVVPGYIRVTSLNNTSSSPTGSIGMIDSRGNGNVGDIASGDYPTFRATTIDTVRGGNIRAYINPSSGVRRVETTTGSFRGSISTTSLLSDPVSGGGIVMVASSCDANILLSQGLRSNDKIVIGRYFGRRPGAIPFGHAQIRLDPPNRLGGQIIFNANNESYPLVDFGDTIDDPWLDPVNIRDGSGNVSYALQDPAYATVSGDVGGGSVGAAPYYLYRTDCQPEADESGTGDGILEDTLNGAGGHVSIRFYGPIQKKYGSAWSSHIMVQCRPFPPYEPCHFPWDVVPCSWIDVSSAFDIAGPSGSTTDPLARRTITLSPKTGYHIRPGIYMAYPVESDSVKSADVAGNPAVVWSALCDNGGGGYRLGYGFVVSGDCDEDEILDQRDCDLSSCTASCDHADFNQSGEVSVQDIFDFLAAYFAGDPSADVNGSSTVTVQDIFDYLAEYFNPACQ